MSASPDRVWSTEEDNILRSLLADGKLYREILPALPKRTYAGAKMRARVLGLKSRIALERYTKDESFWESPAPLNCYYAGLLAADGCLSITSGRCVIWQCSSEDMEYVERFAVACRYSGLIRKQSKALKGRDAKPYVQIRLFSCAKWHADMCANFNLIPNKTYRLAPPKFANDLLACCYLIGYLDGDGSIMANTTTGTVVRLGSSSRPVIEWFKEFVDTHFPSPLRRQERVIHVTCNGNFHRLDVNGISAAKMIDFLRRIDVPRFTRKWDKPEILSLIEGYRTRWPQHWTPENMLSFDASGNIVRGASSDLAPIIPLTPLESVPAAA